MLLVGLTGGLGSGKSTVGRMLAARGATVVDTDHVAREVLSPGSAAESAVLARFGEQVLGSEGSLDRQALARVAFSGDDERRALERITHPLIRERVSSLVAATTTAVVVVEIPLLDAGRRAQYGFDVVVLVDAPAATRMRRAEERGLSPGDARARAAAQPSDAERRAIADRVLVNEGSLADLEDRVGALWSELQTAATGLRPGLRP